MNETDAKTPAALFGPAPPHPFVDDVTAASPDYEGSVFETDAHRRVLGHLPTPSEPRTSGDLLLQRINEDKANPLEDPAHVAKILQELEALGYVTTGLGLRMTDAGLEALQR